MDDKALIEYLLGRHTLTDLVEMLRSTAGCEIDPALDVSKPKSAAIAPTSAPFNANPSPISFSDASSINGSLYSACSDVSAPKLPSTSAPKVRHARARSAGRKALSKLASSRSQTKPVYPTPAKRKATFECPFCAERCITVEISRKNDLKRHFQEFHSSNAVWQCTMRGCQMVFDWKSAYVAHLRTAHSGLGEPPQDVMVNTCPQVVFGCGFNNCKRVFEAVSDVDAGQKAYDYFAHVAEHFEDGLSHKDWCYSTRFRNLMRQNLVEDAWKQRKRTPQQSASWQPLSSFTLRKMLECRHLPDIPSFVQWATTLSTMYSDPRALQPKLPSHFAIPKKDVCPVAKFDHRLDRPGLPFIPHPQNAAATEESRTPLAHFDGIILPSSPEQVQTPLSFSGHIGHPTIGTWVDAVPSGLPRSVPIDPLGNAVSMADISQIPYTQDVAMMSQAPSFDLWPDITFDPTFDPQFELANAITPNEQMCKERSLDASRPPSSPSFSCRMSTSSTASAKDTKVSVPAFKFQFNMH